MIHFYHLWLGGDWKSIAAEHFAALRAADFPGAVQVGLVGSEEAREEAESWLDRQWNYGIAACEDEGFEEVTLHALHRLSRSVSTDTPILYAHNKGSFHPTNTMGLNENDPWRRAMTAYLIEQWRDRVDELLWHDALTWNWLPVGTYELWAQNTRVIDAPMATGNFWWANAGYLRKLPVLPDTLTEENRIEAEVWLGTGNPRVKSQKTGWPDMVFPMKWVENPPISGMQQTGGHWEAVES